MKLKFTLALLCLIAVISFSFKDNSIKRTHLFRSTGAAAAYGAGYTGAIFDNGGANCGNCHGGGSYAPTISITLLNSSLNPVSSYALGASYTLSIVITPNSGSPLFGFQAMCVQQSNNSNINTWGTTLPAAVQNTLTPGGRNYIEQGSPLFSGIINIPWTAPSTAMGAISFYAVGNAVDGGGGTGGDNAVTTNLTIAQGVVPVTFISFNGVDLYNSVKLNWKTVQELNNAYFNVEHSTDGIDFKPVGNVAGLGNSNSGFNYEFIHKQPSSGKNFYRLKQVDVDGTFKYSASIIVKVENKKIVEIYPNPVLDKLMFRGSINLNTSKYKIINQNGVQVSMGIITGNEINVSQLAKGDYYITLIEKNGASTTMKFVK